MRRALTAASVLVDLCYALKPCVVIHLREPRAARKWMP
jgi:hypothetical protein